MSRALEDSVREAFPIPADVKAAAGTALYQLQYGPDVREEGELGFTEALDLVREWADAHVQDCWFIPWVPEVVTEEPDDDLDNYELIDAAIVGRILFSELWEYV